MHDKAIKKNLPSCIILAPCGSRKSIRPTSDASAVSLPLLPQAELETAWSNTLSSLRPEVPACRLYSGRGFYLARRASELTGGTLFVISAGLGIVHSALEIPTYGMTVAGRGPDSIAERTTDGFDPVKWWSAVSLGRYSTSLTTLLATSGNSPVVVALSQPYAKMIAPALASVATPFISRFRFVGVRLKALLPEILHSQILPYDDRLEAVLPGTRSDFAHRAAFHFATKGVIEDPSGDIDAHREWVRRQLANKRAPTLEKRPRLNDEAMISLIRRRLETEKGIAKLLRKVRDDDRIACEQARFSRLYRQAQQVTT